MSFGKTFLRLSIKSQIYLSLFLITVLCLCLMFSFLLILTIESILTKKRDTKKYFYELQYKIINSNIFFQNICILQYEQLLKMLNTQIDYFVFSFEILNKNKKHSEKSISEEYNPSIYEEELNKNKFGNYTKLYYHCYGDKARFNQILSLLDESALILTKHIQSIRIPYYGEDISLLNSYLFFLYRFSGYFSLDINSIKEFYDTYNDNIINSLLFYSIKTIRDSYNIYFEKYIRGELHFFEYMFYYAYNIFENYNNKTFIEKEYNSSGETYIDAISSSFIYFNFGGDIIYLTDNSNINNTRILIVVT